MRDSRGFEVKDSLAELARLFYVGEGGSKSVD